MTEIKIRPYHPADLEATVTVWHGALKAAFPYVAEIQRHSYTDDRAYFDAHIAPNHEVWVGVAEEDGQILGFIAQKGDFIDQLYVALHAQRQGIGTLLLAQARRLSPARLRLFTFQKNFAARGFYEKHGFRAVKFGISPPPESEPDVEYVWENGTGENEA